MVRPPKRGRAHGSASAPAERQAVPCDSNLSDFFAMAACEESLEPKVAAGGDCFMEKECLGGFCNEGASCPGKCVAYAKINESCFPLPCDSGLYCDTLKRTCLAQKADGAYCSRGSECLDGHECTDDKKCVAEVEPRPAALGEACVGIACAKGLYCNAGTCATVLAAGAECGEDLSSALAECGNALACAGFSETSGSEAVIKGKCSPWMDVGGTCTAVPGGSTGFSGCKIGLTCQSGKGAMPPSSGTCAEGEFLTISCDPRSAWCDSSSQCVAKKADGAVCKLSMECQSGDCSDGKCFAGCHP